MTEKPQMPVPQPPKQTSLVQRFAAQYGVDPTKMLGTLKATVFRQPRDNSTGGAVEVTDEQMMMLLVVAEQYGLNPFTRELYAFPDKSKGIVPIVSVDGWSRMVNARPEYLGCTFTYGPANAKGVHEWIECTMKRADREQAPTVREFFAECRRSTGPWDSHPNRMLRHKAFMQAGRITFGFVGIFDEDEGRAIIEGNATRVPDQGEAIDTLNADIRKAPEAAPTAAGAANSEDAPQAVGQSNFAQRGVPSAADEPAYGDVAERIAAAKTDDDLALCADLLRSINDEAQRAELDVELRAKRSALAKGKRQ
jgi:phage recombination protein Bet